MPVNGCTTQQKRKNVHQKKTTVGDKEINSKITEKKS
jgi:hypothetical protein